MVEFTANIGRMSRALNSVNALVDTVPVTFKQDRLQIETIDEVNVGAVSLTLHKSGFEEYSGDNTELHLDIEQMSQILRNFDNETLVTVSYAEEDALVRLDIKGYEFELSTIHRDSVRGGRKAGDVDPPAEVRIEASEVQKAMKLGEMFSEEIILGIDAEREVLYINSRGDAGNMAVSYAASDEEVNFVTNHRAHGVFSHSYLYEMTKRIPAKTEISLRLGEEYPAIIEYEFADGDGEIAYGLAPRIT